MIRFESGYKYFEWMVNISTTSLGTFVDEVITTDLITKNYTNGQIKIDTTDEGVKETIILNSVPPSNEIVFDYNIEPSMYIRYSNADPEETFLTEHNNVTVDSLAIWENPFVYDSNGDRIDAVYVLDKAEQTITLKLNQSQLDSVTYPLTIDPVVNNITSENWTTDGAISIGPNRIEVYSEHSTPDPEHIALFSQISGFNPAQIWVSTDKFVSDKTNESGASGLNDGLWDFFLGGALLDMEENGVLAFVFLFESGNRDCRCNRRTVGGSWQTVRQVATPSNPGTYNHRAVAYDSTNEDVYLLYLKSGGNLELRRSTDFGDSWGDAPDNGGTLGDNSVNTEWLELLMDGENLHIFYRDSSSYLRHQIYNTSTGVFGTSVVIDNTRTCASESGNRGSRPAAMLDSSRNIHLTYTNSSKSGLHYFQYNGASWSYKCDSTIIGQTYIDDNDLVFICENDISTFASDFEIYNSGTNSFDKTSNWISNGKTIGLAAGHNQEDIHGAVAKSGVLAWWEDSNYQFPAGDVTAPTITGQDPSNGETGVSISTNIYFELDDDISGVDLSTINVTIEEVDAIVDGVLQSGFSGSITPNGLGYDVDINPDENFEFNQVINVTVNASDLSANAMVEVAYSFTCESLQTRLPVPDMVSPLYGEITRNVLTFNCTEVTDVQFPPVLYRYKYWAIDNPEEVFYTRFSTTRTQEVKVDYSKVWMVQAQAIDSRDF